jgi:hypothetical protein
MLYVLYSLTNFIYKKRNKFKYIYFVVIYKLVMGKTKGGTLGMFDITIKQKH